jgi:hypothetical protein
MAKRPAPASLDRWARMHVQYEAHMLVAGATNLHPRYSPIPPPDGFKRPIVDDALLEATLVHVRLVHEFPRAARPKWDLCAYAHTCCRELDRFLDEVDRRCPSERAAAFEDTRKHIQRGLVRLKRT